MKLQIHYWLEAVRNPKTSLLTCFRAKLSNGPLDGLVDAPDDSWEGPSVFNSVKVLEGPDGRAIPTHLHLLLHYEDGDFDVVKFFRSRQYAIDEYVRMEQQELDVLTRAGIYPAGIIKTAKYFCKLILMKDVDTYRQERSGGGSAWGLLLDLPVEGV